MRNELDRNMWQVLSKFARTRPGLLCFVSLGLLHGHPIRDNPEEAGILWDIPGLGADGTERAFTHIRPAGKLMGARIGFAQAGHGNIASPVLMHGLGFGVYKIRQLNK